MSTIRLSQTNNESSFFCVCFVFAWCHCCGFNAKKKEEEEEEWGETSSDEFAKKVLCLSVSCTYLLIIFAFPYTHANSRVAHVYNLFPIIFLFHFYVVCALHACFCGRTNTNFIFFDHFYSQQYIYAMRCVIKRKEIVIK